MPYNITMEEEQYKLKKDINTKLTMVSGSGWRGGAELFRLTWSSVVILILASMLDPIVFGLVGMTDALVQLFNVFMTMGFDSAIIQQEQINDRILSSLFWLNLGLGLVLATIGAAVAPLLVWFYQENRVGPIFLALCGTFILQSLSVVQQGLLTRELAFRSLALVDIVASIVSSIAAIVVAIRGGSYWSLVVLQLGKQAIMALGYWFSSSWRPQLVFDLKASMPSVRFSSNILLFDFLNFFATRSDIILVGRLLGAEQAGFYLLANRLIMNPVGQVLNVLTSTLYPILSVIQHNVAKVRETYIKVTVITFSAMAPVIILAGILGPKLIPHFLGPEWEALVPIFLVWCFGAAQRIVMSRQGILFLVMGRPDLQWKYQLFSTPIVIIALLFGVQQGALGASVSYNLAQFSVLFVSLYLAFTLIDLRISTYFKRFRFTALALLGVILPGIGLMSWFSSFSWHPIVISGLIVIITLSIYSTVLYLLDPYMRQLLTDGRFWLSERFMKSAGSK